jgi:hypothetical protein
VCTFTVGFDGVFPNNNKKMPWFRCGPTTTKRIVSSNSHKNNRCFLHTVLLGAIALSVIPLLLIVSSDRLFWEHHQLDDRHYYQEEQQQPEPRDKKCLGRKAYKEWIESLFALAPPAPNCIDVETFLSHYNQTSSAWVYGTTLYCNAIQLSSTATIIEPRRSTRQ